METILDTLFWIVLFAHLVMALVAIWRIGRGENGLARLSGLDLFSTLTIATLVIISIIRKESIFIDVAIAAAALGYLSTVALAKYIAEHRMV